MLQLVIERAAAVVGNLSTNDQFFSAIREAGAIQRLVRLLDSGSTHRTTEIAAKTLANLASESSNRKGIRLAGGVPPLMRLLMDRPSEQVSTSNNHKLWCHHSKTLLLVLMIRLLMYSNTGNVNSVVHTKAWQDGY